MPAMLEDPEAPVIYRSSGEPPYPTPQTPLSADFAPRQVTLRDRSTVATLFAFSSPDQVPKRLVAYLCALLNREIEKGDTYPMIFPLPLESFGPYWFANFGAVMLLGQVVDMDQVWKMDNNGTDWDRYCLGSFYVKPNYPGRSSHICNGGFLVGDASRNRGVGRLMGECYLEWAPKLGYTYSIFNLVYETNMASLRIWDALGFKRVGRVKGGGNLKSHPDRLIDAIIFGRDLNGDAEDYLSEERFDKIRFYLKTNTYPAGSDRAEKSRLRSASAHYRLTPATNSEEEKLMLKDKEVISDPARQYQIAQRVHSVSHGGINKTTAAIAETYHWVRIKETVSAAIRNCSECKEAARPSKTPVPSEDPAERLIRKVKKTSTSPAPVSADDDASPTEAVAESPSPPPASQQAAPAPLTMPVAPMSPEEQPSPQQQHPIPIPKISTPEMVQYEYGMHMSMDTSLEPPLGPNIMDGIREHAGVDHYPSQDQMEHYQQHYDMPQDYDHDMDSSYLRADPQVHAGAQNASDSRAYGGQASSGPLGDHIGRNMHQQFPHGPT